MSKGFDMIQQALGIMPKDNNALTGAADEIAAGQPIGKKEIAKAVETLKKYKDGKQNLETSIVENEQWFKGRHWDLTKRTSGNTAILKADGESGVSAADSIDRPQPTSAWLFNSLANNHADAMDNYPEPNVLPREQGDKQAAESLSDIIPVVLERNNFEETYDNAWWYKLKQGFVPYGVFWNPSLENGLGDIDIRKLDALNVFWEPGITDIQQSRNLFIISLQDKDLLEEEYPDLKGKIGGNAIDVKQYVYDDAIDISEKVVVVDWYYKKRKPVNDIGISTGNVLHYCKFVGDNVLFASENDPNYADGWYDHGLYPVEFDVLFPEEGTPYGFGYLAIMKDPQMYIDKLSQIILENAAMAARPRYWGKESMGINEQEFLDWNKPIIHVQGEIDDEKLRALDVPNMPGSVLNILQMKIDELKETSGNNDATQGKAGAGVTAAAAIAALQEAGNKTSRDMISASYRVYTKICYLVIELIRQFYDESRSFRISGKDGAERFVQFSNAQMKGVPMDPAYAGQQMQPGYVPSERKPIFDISIKPQKRSAYSRLSQNELAKELYGLGLFNPENAEQALMVLDMMDFDGDEEIKQKVQKGHTLLNMVMGLQQQVQALNEALRVATAGRVDGLAAMTGGQQPVQHSQPQQIPEPEVMNSKKEAERNTMTPYGQRLAQRATPHMGE